MQKSNLTWGLARVRTEALRVCLTCDIQQWIRLCWRTKLAQAAQRVIPQAARAKPRRCDALISRFRFHPFLILSDTSQKAPAL